MSARTPDDELERVLSAANRWRELAEDAEASNQALANLFHEVEAELATLRQAQDRLVDKWSNTASSMDTSNQIRRWLAGCASELAALASPASQQEAAEKNDLDINLLQRLNARLDGLVNRGGAICAKAEPEPERTHLCKRCDYPVDLHLLRDIRAVFVTPPARQQEPTEGQRVPAGFLYSMLSGLRTLQAYMGDGRHAPECNGGDDGPCDCGYIDPDDVVEALLDQIERDASPAPSPQERPEPEDALRWLVNLFHGISKHGGDPQHGEWPDAIKAAKAALSASPVPKERPEKCDGTCNPFSASCGAVFCTSEERDFHERTNHSAALSAPSVPKP